MQAKTISFTETQRFTQWWIWLFLVGLGCIPLFGIYYQLVKGTPFGNNPMSDGGLVLFSVFVFGFIWFFYSIKLITKIDATGIAVSLTPFTKNHFNWDTIKTIEVIKYNPLFTGGFGLRYTFKYGTVYNIQGNKGFLITLKTGKKYLIGTQKTEELKKLLQ